MAQDTPYNPFSIILGRCPIYIGAKPLSAYNFPPQPGSVPQSFVKVSGGEATRLLVSSLREFQTKLIFFILDEKKISQLDHRLSTTLSLLNAHVLHVLWGGAHSKSLDRETPGKFSLQQT